MAVQPIFSGGQLPANVVTTQQMPRLANDAAPVQVAQVQQFRTMLRELEDSAERAPRTLSNVGSSPTYDIHARVEPVPGDGRRQGSLFDRRA